MELLAPGCGIDTRAPESRAPLAARVAALGDQGPDILNVDARAVFGDPLCKTFKHFALGLGYDIASRLARRCLRELPEQTNAGLSINPPGILERVRQVLKTRRCISNVDRVRGLDCSASLATDNRNRPAKAPVVDGRLGCRLADSHGLDATVDGARVPDRPDGAGKLVEAVELGKLLLDLGQATNLGKLVRGVEEVPRHLPALVGEDGWLGCDLGLLG